MSTEIDSIIDRWETHAVPMIDVAERMAQLAEMHGTWQKADEAAASRNEVLAEFAEEMIVVLRTIRGR